MSVRETSLEAYRTLEGTGALQEQEKKLMRLVHRHYPLPAKFTRKELAAVTGWGINVIAGRTHGLVAKGWLTDYPETRDGGHLLSISEPKTAAPAPVAAGESVSPLTTSSPSIGALRADAPPVAAVPNVKSMLDDLKSGDLVIDHGWLCEVVMPPEVVTGYSPNVNGRPSKDLRYEAMSLRQIRRVA